MQRSLWWLTNLILSGVLSVAFILWYWQGSQKDVFEIVFLDVGQGDAILIQDGETQILIDGGRDGLRLLSHLGRYVPFWDRKIEVAVATHPDSDHIGGLPALFRNYQIGTLLTNGQKGNTEVSGIFYDLVTSRHIETKEVAEGSEVVLPSEVKLRFLYPLTPIPPESSIETNEGSLVARLDFFETSFLFTGDLPHEELALPSLEPVDVLKVAHHGSRFSTSGTFLDVLSPQEAVISVGENSYGHPHPTVLENLKTRGVAVLRTDESGDIVYRCHRETKRCAREE